MKIYRTPDGLVAAQNGSHRRLEGVKLDELFTEPDALPLWRHLADSGPVVEPPTQLLPPLQSQEVWAAGVTYFRSMKARMEEAKEASGGDFYDRVYVADRPELFMKATPQRVVGPGKAVRVRSDSKWTVPEPELALAVNAAGQIIGYSIGNDMSARDIEGENPLYLPQAKSYRDSCALGPCLFLASEPIAPSESIRLEILRDGAAVFTGETQIREMKRSLDELVSWLYRDNVLEQGCYLLTGTGIVPPDDFTLQEGDVVRITIAPIGMLENPVAST